MNQIIANFQFIRPEFLLALIPLIIGYVLKLKFAQQTNVWQQILPSHLYQNMVIKKGFYQSNNFIHVLMIAMIVSIIAIAGPTWEKLPQTVYQSQAGKVVLIDMSMSMRATDIAPDRLTRAKFKALDLIDEVKEGETGVIAYAGDAFVISPLTDDISNLKTLIPSLSPEIMPLQGSYALYGLQRSEELLKNAGYQSGQIYWITDGIQYEEIKDIREFIQGSSFEVSALLVGTEAGAPISMLDGQLLKDRTGKIVIPSIDERYLNQALQGTRGNYQLFTSDNSDVKAIKRKIEFEQRQASEVQDTTADVFKDMGPYLVVLLLPVAAYAFRKGVLSLLLAIGITFSMANSNPALAQSTAQTPELNNRQENNLSVNSWVNALFKNSDQKGKMAFDNAQYEQANKLFKDLEWQAASAYKMGDYAQAEEIYQGLDGIENLYNKANAQAKQGKLSEALESYEQVLNNLPSHQQALKNKELIEDLLEQQSKNEQENQENSNQESSQDKQSQQEQSNDSNQQDPSSQSESQQNNQQQRNNEQRNQEQNSQQQNQDNSQSSAQKENATQPQEQQKQNEADSNKKQTDNDQNDLNNKQSQPENSEQQQSDLDEQIKAISNQINMDDLTPEQKEELQRMQMIMNKIPDDPAFLLKRKMLLEAQRRQRSPQAPTQQNW